MKNDVKILRNKYKKKRLEDKEMTIELNSSHGDVKIFAKTIEPEALGQVTQIANTELAENAHIRIMPDCHAGAGCVIGTTMKITDKVCPNLVGVDIGCGVTLVKTSLNFRSIFERLDDAIRRFVPYGADVHENAKDYDFTALRCWDKLKKTTKERAICSLGTLGGGNHFIEAYDDGYISVHSGSRNIGGEVAKYYQKLAEQTLMEEKIRIRHEDMLSIPPKEREMWKRQNRVFVNKALSFLQGDNLQDYLHDIAIMQDFANKNRAMILDVVVSELGGKITEGIDSIHNYIDIDNMILRKGAISAQEGEIIVIPLNMRDGILICEGKGNEDWNCSAPHGAGRLYSRSKAKELITIQQYRDSMDGVYSSCINESTIDESPFAYKDFKEIMECIKPTVCVKEILLPVYNFKAN